LAGQLVKQGGLGINTKLLGLQNDIQKVGGPAEREKLVEEFDNIVASACILCSDFAIKLIDEPFVLESDDKTEWAV